MLIVHAPVLLALIALQFHACSAYKPSPLSRRFCRAMTIIGIAAAPICLYVGGIVGIRAAIAALIIAATGLARNVESISRWYRWLALASWCLCVLASLAVVGYIVTRRFFS
jgi:hypothetical protein